ncbi:MAG: hypothetical protein M1591_05285 [Deltaproteobacteria bacterium]|nr:hypothetical protein [Deltaproteobacteria bacterium]
MFQSLPILSKTNNGQAMVEYLLVTAVLSISAGIAVKMLGTALSAYFSFLAAFIALPIP